MTPAPSFLVGPYRITPHPDAPMFANPESSELALTRVIGSLQGTTALSSEVSELVRQLALVSLWFFINVILKPSGAYEALDDALAIDQCNFRQSDVCMQPGATAATFMPRGFSKSRINTHGATTWELARNGNLTVVIANAIYEKALEFLHQVQRNITENDMIRRFFPEMIPGKGAGQCTDKVLILPNRTVSSVEPSCRCLGLTGAAEGGHYDLIVMDDLVGLDALDGQRQSSATMEMAKKWFRTNQNALRKTRASRIILAATRYAIDDCYEDIYAHCRTVTGWTIGDLQPVEGGTWDIYYRLVEENGWYLRPDVMDKVTLENLIRDDYWAAMTQYYNSPTKTGLAEFVNAEVRLCSLIWDEPSKEWWIRKEEGNWDVEQKEIRLGSCDVLLSTDLAATEAGIKAKSCRSALAVWAKDADNNVYRVWSRVGYFSIFQIFDFIFDAHKTFPGLIRMTIIESNAFQKIIKPLLQREELVRNVSIRPMAVNAQGDKKARIRTAWGPALARRQVFATLETGKPVLEELRVFPMSETRLDTLDESEKAFVYLVRPDSQDERNRQEEEEETRAMTALNAVGY